MSSLLARVVLGAGIAAAVVGGQPARAEAQRAPAAPSPAQRAAAEKLVTEGIAAYDAKDYDKAIELYQKAFDLIPHPILLFNIGQAHRLAGRPAAAVPFYQRYLEADPSGGEAENVRNLLAGIEALPPAEPVAPPPAPAPAEDVPVPPPVVLDEPLEAAARPGRGLRITGLALGGAGAALGITSAVVALQMRSLQEDAIAKGPPYDDATREKGERLEDLHKLTLAVAGGLVVGAAVVYWIGHRQGRAAPTTALVPSVGPDFAGLAFTGLLR